MTNTLYKLNLVFIFEKLKEIGMRLKEINLDLVCTHVKVLVLYIESELIFSVRSFIWENVTKLRIIGLFSSQYAGML